ncbi:DNA-directed RNA polymerase subunit delta [Mycoplasmatota bacterium]|nr:DNA-directed RNA polymerase subunit delta [Mycoplasmatota bacterium]
MNQNLELLAMIDIAEIILKESNEPLEIKEIIKKVVEIKKISENDFEKITQLYMDITQSGKFVFCGEEKWDLKERNLELWDKDGYAFVKLENHDDVEEADDDEELEFTEFNLEDIQEEEVEADEDEEEAEEVIDETEKEALKEEKAYIEVELPIKSTDDDVDDDVEIEFDGNDYDEDDYNEIMDDYEDMYDK